MKTEDSLDNYAYILRLWRERPASPEQMAVWRLSLTDVRNGERRGFGDPEALLAFLHERITTHSNRSAVEPADNE